MAALVLSGCGPSEEVVAQCESAVAHFTYERLDYAAVCEPAGFMPLDELVERHDEVLAAVERNAELARTEREDAAVAAAEGMTVEQQRAAVGIREIQTYEWAEVEGQQAEVVRWVDGDTVDTTAGRVRLIGVDAPEIDTCAGRKATEFAERLVPAGSSVVLQNPESVRETDKYDRLLRYVFFDRWDSPADMGYQLITSGYANARYDSRDGYEWHPHEPVYRFMDEKTSDTGQGYCDFEQEYLSNENNDWFTPDHVPGDGRDSNTCYRGRIPYAC